MLLLGPVATQVTSPSLECYGEPMLGRSLAIVGKRIPASAQVWLFQGEWAPGSSSLGSCMGHVLPTGGPLVTTSDASGMARWSLVVPLAPALLSQSLGLQGWVISNATLTNGLHLGIGGGL